MSGIKNKAPRRFRSRLQPGPGWRIALLAGFAVQLLLILFVTGIGLRQLSVTADNLKTVVDVHMRKQNLVKSMVLSAREQTLNLFRMGESRNLFERDQLRATYGRNVESFVKTRAEFMGMPLGAAERALLERLPTPVVSMQDWVADPVDADAAGKTQVLETAMAAQNAILGVLAQLDAETQKLAMAASTDAAAAHKDVRFWMHLLAAAALALGLAVALAAVRYAGRSSREREHLTTHDALTGLPNRMLCMDRIEQALARAHRRGSLAGVLFIDVDRFKLVNDTLGHTSGDSLICEVAVRLRNAVRGEDIVARVGGDEFVVVITEAGKVGNILQAAEKIIALLAEPYRIDEREIFSTCSIGVSLYPHDGENAVALVKNADTAMHHAKKRGSNRFQLYDKAMNALAEERLQLETDLHYALQRGEFAFHYQPQLDVETGRIQSFEALLRWQHPQRGLLRPADFLELLDETGEVVNVGRRLLIEACCEAKGWHLAGHDGLGVAVNVSGKEFWHETLVANVRAALEISGLAPQFLQLELTEGIFMQDIDRAVNRILALKQLGVALAIDDFGTGYSSLAHLKRFPLDCLKIDRYFVKDIEVAIINEAFIRSILALCQGLHLDSVAEGVENVRQLERLRRLGCRVVQGDLISSPVAAQDVGELLRRDWLAELRGEAAAGLGQASVSRAGPDPAPVPG
ncbi:EAL domain-containing protein [Betaproteobacteria bacterium SCN2]|jgi:diguanylate cyclase (GGDEF)-like protein|nr:EAL domain-containing protein [Betaproteobacteria bacterium SCN2]